MTPSNFLSFISLSNFWPFTNPPLSLFWNPFTNFLSRLPAVSSCLQCVFWVSDSFISFGHCVPEISVSDTQFPHCSYFPILELPHGLHILSMEFLVYVNRNTYLSLHLWGAFTVTASFKMSPYLILDFIFKVSRRK